MRKIFYVFAIILTTPVVFVAAALCAWWLTTTNNTSVNINNRSGHALQNLVIAAPGRTERFGDFGIGHDGAFSADPRVTFDVRVSFDADGRHYDLPARTYMLPFGDTIVSLTLDKQLRLLVCSKPTFMFR